MLHLLVVPDKEDFTVLKISISIGNILKSVFFKNINTII